MTIKYKFGRLRVIKTEMRKVNEQHRTFAWCRCECGRLCWFRFDHLKSGNTQSCGCLRSDNLRWVRHHAWKGAHSH